MPDTNLPFKTTDQQALEALRLLFPSIKTTGIFSWHCQESCCKPRREAYQALADWYSKEKIVDSNADQDAVPTS